MKKTFIQVLISFILFIIALLVNFENQLVNIGLYIISYLIVGLEVIAEAIKNIIKGEFFDENFLMSLATIGAFTIGEYPEAVAVMLFYQVGEMFQDYAVDKSKESITSLMDIRPDCANVRRDDNLEKVDPNEVNVGEIIIIRPGEKIPLDGIILEGTSMIDTSALTGESVPRKAKKGENILSGCINLNGMLTVEVTKKFGESTVSKILDLVENATSKKSKSENFITKFAKYYTPIVVFIALILTIFPPFVLKIGDFTTWLYRALSFLVVSCPCALVISIPLGFFSGIGRASRCGVLIKGSNYLEALANTEIFVFDKTGTLTEGVFEVQEISNIDIEKEELIKLTAYAENYSNHPISLSVKNAYEKEIDEKLIKKTEELAGRGIYALVEDKEVLVGNSKLMKERNIEYQEYNKIGTILYVAIDNKFAGTIVISDKIKNDSKITMKELKKNNIKKTVMLTGDKKEVAQSVAKEIEIDEVYSELLPDGKVEKVEELMKQKSDKGKLAFVGDGINDAPVLAISDVGIAMGGLGSDAAIEAADIVIMTDEPSKIGDAIKISKKTLKIVKENIGFAIFVKIAVLLLSVIGVATMWEAVFADVGVSVIAVLNSIRILKNKN